MVSSPPALAPLHDRFMRLRGVALPFTTPVARFVRARLGPNDKREFVVPGLVGNRADYVVPLSYLPELAALTVHDRMLWEALKEAPEVMPPATVQRLARGIAQTGVLGVVRAEAARTEAKREAERQFVTHAALLGRLLEEVAPETARQLAGGPRAGFRPEKVQQALVATAAPLGVSPARLFDRLGEIAALLGGIGFSTAEPQAGARGLCEGLGRFAEAVDRFAADEPPEFAANAYSLLQIADATYQALSGLLRQVDADLDDVRRLTAEAEAREALALKAAEVQWTVDGWAEILAEWNIAAEGQRLRQRELALLLARVAPPLPGHEAARGRPAGGLAELAARDILGLIDKERLERVAQRAARHAAA